MDSAEEMEEFIRGAIQNRSSADEVIRVVRALTHEKGSDYSEYVMSLLGDVPALRVKLADMVHNLSDSPRPKQKIKYRKALNTISYQTGGKPPSGISPEHWDTLFSLTEATSHSWNRATASSLNLDADGMEEIDRFNVIDYLKKMGLLK